MSEINNTTPTYIFSLGGIEEIGKNMYIIEHDDEIWIIDCGVKFVDKNVYLGFDSIIPPFDYLELNKHKIKGLIITHAHEDHIGGIPYLLKTLPIPKLYGAKLTKGIVELKLKEHKDLHPYDFVEVDDKSVLKSKHFTIDFFRVCHSVPDDFGVCLQTINGIIASTADFRFDFLTKGDETDIWKITEIGRRNVDVLMCECTNAQNPGFSMSEKYIIDELRRIIKRCPGRIFLTTFASNLERIEELIEIAVKAGRKIVIGGRSMDNNISVSIKSGFLNIGKEWFVEMRDISKYNDNELFIITTGSQGEEMSALSQMAAGEHAWVEFKNTDTVIFSSNAIPGNFASVEALVNKLHKKGVHVITNTNERKIHASGHATQTELQLMLKIMNPNYIIPIHGEFKMLTELKRNGQNIGIPSDHILQVQNGQKVSLLNHEATITDQQIEIYNVFVDSGKINKDSSGVLRFRQTLSSEGVIGITILINKVTRRLQMLPIFSIRGSFYAQTSNQMLTKIGYDIKEQLEKEMDKRKVLLDNKEIRKIVENITDFYIWKNKKKRPLIRVTVFDL